MSNPLDIVGKATGVKFYTEPKVIEEKKEEAAASSKSTSSSNVSSKTSSSSSSSSGSSSKAAFITPQTTQELIDVVTGKIDLQPVSPVQVASKVETGEPVYESVHEYSQASILKKIETSESQSISELVTPKSDGVYIQVSSTGETRFSSGASIEFEAVRNIAELLTVKKEVSSLPSGTAFIKTKEGFSINLPENITLRQSQIVRREEGKLPPVISEISRFGTGITESMLALAKPFFELTGQGEKIESGISTAYAMALHPAFIDKEAFGSQLVESLSTVKYGVHHPSVFDIAFEPIGWSPKGSARFFLNDPFFAMGGVAGEVAQSIAMTEMLKPVGAGIKAGVKGIVRNIPEVYEFIGRPLPRLAAGVGETGFSKNIYNWAARGYVKGLPLVDVSSKVSTKGFLTTQKTVFKTKGLFSSRVWMSPEEVAVFESRMLGSKEFSFFIRGEGGVGRATTVFESTVYKQKGLFGGKLERIYSFARSEKDVGSKLISSVYDEDIAAGLGSYYRNLQKNVFNVIDVGLETTKDFGDLPLLRGSSPYWYEPVQNMYKYGYPQTGVLESGAVQVKEWTKGFGAGISKPASEKWAEKIGSGFIRSEEASMSLVPVVSNVLKSEGKAIGSVSSAVSSAVLKVPLKVAGSFIPSSILFTSVKISTGFANKELLNYRGSINLPVFNVDRGSHKAVASVTLPDITGKYETGSVSDLELGLGLDVMQDVESLMRQDVVSRVEQVFDFDVVKDVINETSTRQVFESVQKVKTKGISMGFDVTIPFQSIIPKGMLFLPGEKKRKKYMDDFFDMDFVFPGGSRKRVHPVELIKGYGRVI